MDVIVIVMFVCVQIVFGNDNRMITGRTEKNRV